MNFITTQDRFQISLTALTTFETDEIYFAKNKCKNASYA